MTPEQQQIDQLRRDVAELSNIVAAQRQVMLCLMHGLDRWQTLPMLGSHILTYALRGTEESIEATNSPSAARDMNAAAKVIQEMLDFHTMQLCDAPAKA